MAKPRLTIDEHRHLGRTLADIRDQLQAHAVALDGAYPRSGPESVAARKLRAAYETLDEARSALESALFREHPAEADPDIYYPAQRRDTTGCTATGTIRLVDMDVAVLCNDPEHDGPDHHDNVHGDWSGDPQA